MGAGGEAVGGVGGLSGGFLSTRLPGCAAGGRHASPQAAHPGAGRRGCESNLAVALVWLALVAMHIEKCFAFMRCAGFDG